MGPLIELDRVSFAYPGGRQVLDSLDFILEPGKRVGIIGHNGSGKTTLLHLIMGLLRPGAGSIRLFGREMNEPEDFVPFRGRVGLLFQDADDQLFSPTVLEDVAFGPLNQGKTVEEAREVAMNTLAELGIAPLSHRFTHQLSGGEKRLVALATLLSMDPEVLLLDEPTSGLDEPTRGRLVSLVRELDVSWVIISHEYEFLAEVCDAIFLLEDGRIVEDTGEIVHAHVHAHPHGRYPHRHLP